MSLKETLDDLAKRVKAATPGADNTAICVDVHKAIGTGDGIPSYTTSLAAARSLFDRHDGFEVGYKYGLNGVSCIVRSKADEVQVRAATDVLATLLAAITLAASREDQ